MNSWEEHRLYVTKKLDFVETELKEQRDIITCIDRKIVKLSENITHFQVDYIDKKIDPRLNNLEVKINGFHKWVLGAVAATGLLVGIFIFILEKLKIL